jgi:hypothetical protein
MTAQAENTNLIEKEITQTNWLQRVGLFAIPLICGLAIRFRGFASRHFPAPAWKLPQCRRLHRPSKKKEI